MGKTKTMIDTDYEQQILWIDSILDEASRYNLHTEVRKTAEKLLESNPEMDVITAYKQALDDYLYFFTHRIFSTIGNFLRSNET